MSDSKSLSGSSTSRPVKAPIPSTEKYKNVKMHRVIRFVCWDVCQIYFFLSEETWFIMSTTENPLVFN